MSTFGGFHGPVRVHVQAQFQKMLALPFHPIPDFNARAGPDNASMMHRLARKAGIAIVSPFEKKRAPILPGLGIKRPCAAGHTVRPPDFGLIPAVDGQPVMARAATVVLADLAVRILAASRIDNDPPSIQGQLEAQGVAMRVAGLVVRPDRTAVRKKDITGARREAKISAIGKRQDRRIRLPRLFATQGREVRRQFGMPRFDAKRGVVKEGDAAIRMSQPPGKLQHGRDHPFQFPLKRTHLIQSAGPAQIEEVQAVLQDHAVVHGAALEMTAVGQDLFGQLLGRDAQTKMQPAPGFPAVEKDPGEDQRLGVLEIVIGQ